ncbi:MAG: ferritin family protein [Magnetococcales bacterium]|nr:ferritin family protein [Magnetococcales bacterium]
MKNVDKLLKAAILHEVKAGAFYNRAAEVTNNDESRMLFLELAGMEDDHAGGLVKSAKKDPALQRLDAEAMLKDAMNSTEGKISKKEEDTISSGNLKEVLEMAIGFEKEAEETYRKMATKAKDDNFKAFCEQLCKEEAGHKNSLTTLLNNLDMDIEDRPAM